MSFATHSVECICIIKIEVMSSYPSRKLMAAHTEVVVAIINMLHCILMGIFPDIDSISILQYGDTMINF